MKRTIEKILLTVIILIFFIPLTIHSQVDSLLADSLYYSGKDHYYDRDYSKARKDFEESLTIFQRLYGEEHKLIAKTLFRLAKVENKAGNYRRGLQYIEKSFEQTKKYFDKDDDYIGNHYIELGHAYGDLYDLDKTKYYYDLAVDFVRKKEGEENEYVGSRYMDIGIAMMKMGNYSDAEKYFNKSFEIFKKHSHPESEDFNRIYNNLGYMYRKMGNKPKSLDYARKALEVKLLNYNEYHQSVAKYYINLGKAYLENGEFEKGKKFIEKHLEVQIKSSGKNHRRVGSAYNEIGNMYADIGETKKALEIYQKAYSIHDGQLDITHPYVIATYTNIGMSYEDLKEYEKAKSFYQEAIKRYQSHTYVMKHFVASEYMKIAKISLRQNEYEEALDQLGLAMENIGNGYDYNKNEFYKNPKPSQVQEELLFIDLLKTKARVFEYRYHAGSAKQNSSDLEYGLKSLELAIEVIEKKRKSFQSENSRQGLNERVASIFKAAVRISYELYHISGDGTHLLNALNFSEKSKASILWQHLNSNVALASSGIPEEELNALESLGSQINEFKESIYKVKSSEKEELQSQLFDLQLKYDEKITELEKYNSKYFELKYSTPSIDIERLQNKIPNDETVLVEYFYDDENVYTFLISKNELKGFRNSYSEKIETAIKYLRDFDIKDYVNDSNQNDEVYIVQLNYLHEKLIEPIEKELASKNQIIFVPHGVLNYLSFEILTKKSDQNDFRFFPYLLTTHTIQYANSLAIWQNENSQQSNYKYDLLAFAPFSNNEKRVVNTSIKEASLREEFSELNHSKNEIEQAQNYFSGKLFFNKNAKETDFQQYAPDSRIIHLATHAIANDQSPMQSGLVFSNQSDTLEDGYLNAYEIYNMKIPSELAIMSACNTGFGKLAEGEGVISLGRAFSYAGCKSVLMSMWKANDRSTSKIMNYFYEDLAEGKRKDAALRNAKLRYLEESDALTSHPYFWAGMVGVGEMSALDNKGNSIPWSMILFGSVLLGFLFFWSKNKN